ncbi:MAG: winged helix-turn-helix transcriptional regulator [Bacteroides sp.]|nr:winged helix-turn-helix transcriptional regulator [Bacteroides sp.]
MKNNPQITQRELSKILNITIDGVKYHIKNLSKKGIIRREGSDRAGTWKVTE